MKIEVPHSAVGLDAFADFYRFPAGREDSAPMVIWIGGAISEDKYESRRTTEPLAVLAELEAARTRLGDPPCDALFLSSPPTLGIHGTHAHRTDSFYRFLAHELFRLLPPRHPSSLAVIGYSFGGYLATSFAILRPDARALVTIAGVGLREALAPIGGLPPPQLALRCYANDQDFVGSYTLELQKDFAQRGRTLDVIERFGDHPFEDYAENGTIADAFEFVLLALAAA